MVANLLQYQKAGAPDKVIVDQHVPCEHCGSSDAKCTYADGHSYCFSCSHFTPSNDRFDDLNEAFSYEYLPQRGVEASAFRLFDVKTKCTAEGKPIEIGYRYPNGSYKIRSLAEKDFRSVGEINKAGLFGRDKFPAGSNASITITEGELDALSLYQVLRTPCVSVRSSSSAVLDCTLDRSYLNSFDRIVLAFDGDGPGRDACAGVARLFDPSKVFVVKFDGGERKDANDFVRAGEADQLRTIWNNARKYQPDSIKSTLSDFRGILFQPRNKGIPFPWPTLTDMTYGLRLNETYLITALEGVGKTEICRAIEYQLLRETDSNVGALFIEEPTDHHIKRLAGVHAKAPVHLPDSGVDNERIFTTFEEVVGKDDRLFIYNHFGSDDPDVFLDIIRFLVTACNCRYIILDHLSMVVSGLRTDKATQALDYISTQLEMMVVALGFCLILVSHVNDEGETRGSRNIAKIANTRIHLTRDVRNGSLVTNFSLWKNRFGFKTGYAGSVEFDPQTWLLNEVQDATGERTGQTVGTSPLWEH